MSLATTTALRLRLAGFTRDDPGLAFIRRWNADARARADAAEIAARARARGRSNGEGTPRDDRV